MSFLLSTHKSEYPTERTLAVRRFPERKKTINLLLGKVRLKYRVSQKWAKMDNFRSEIKTAIYLPNFRCENFCLKSMQFLFTTQQKSRGENCNEEISLDE